MGKYYILYNPLTGGGSGYRMAKHLKRVYKGEDVGFQDVTRILDFDDFWSSLPEDANVVVCGGDGTLNRFVNALKDREINHPIFYCAGGSGNDFMKDLSLPESDIPIRINDYLENVPVVTIKGREYRFLNGIGIGIDGYCCEVGEKTRGTSKRPINYTKIALEGFLFYFKPFNAIVTVDGVSRSFKDVWLAPTMNGRYFGGGMMPTPDQDRLNPEHKLSVMVLHGSMKLRIIELFPSVFKGTHIKEKKLVEILEGNKIKVECSRPVPVRVDGEVIPGVTAYSVVSR